MECPFKSMEFYDFNMFELKATVLVEQVEALMGYIKQQYQTDNELYPSLSGLETILKKVKEYIAHQSHVYDLFQKDFNKNRALADGCSQAKALGEIEK